MFAFSMLAFSTLSSLQDLNEWNPLDISFKENKTSQEFRIEHAKIVDLLLAKSMQHPQNFSTARHEGRYAICSYELHGLSIVDYALLAQLAYFDSEKEDFHRLFSALFRFPKDFQLRMPPIKNRKKGHAQFYDIYSSKRNLSIIAISGTDLGRISDIVEDMKMYAESLVFTILSWIFPTIRVWPDTTTSFLIQFFHELLYIFNLHDETWYFNSLTEYVESLKNTTNVVLTGHSLGGGLAIITGALTRHPSVGFSAPGITHGWRKVLALRERTKKYDRKYGKNKETFPHTALNIVPANDPIAMVDSHAGMVQKIACKHTHQALQMSCHMLEAPTICF
ncbi:uncharacterized protein LOC135120872 [Zophobas morio]|uniref:uncharacterized protein LOC135120872 n=1 Tax=Zophobas morio TaxID=2755281 RepID=UPI0030836FDE